MRRPPLRLGLVLALALVFGWLASRLLAAPMEQTAASLPDGTALYVRLDTPASTEDSHLHAPVGAHVVREVVSGQAVAIPLGAVVRGEITKIIPASGPSDRARLLLRFQTIELPGQSAGLPITAHVTEVENARETVKADGTITGVLANEVPLTMLDNLIGKLGPLTKEARKEETKKFGKTNTAIALPAGTDLDLALDQPLVVERSFPPAAASQLPAELRSAIDRMLADAPKRAESKAKKPGDPLNLILVGTAEQIQAAFQQAGWSVPQRSSRKSISSSTSAMIEDSSYGVAPISDLYLYGKKEELAFEKMFNTLAKRHHLRIWQSPVTAPDGRPIWLVAATHDIGIDIHPGVVSHAIDPNLDLERAKVGADLMAAGGVSAEQLVTPPNALSNGMTATGGTWNTDGSMLVAVLK